MATRASSARRYAEAVFDLARDSEAFMQWSDDLQTITDFAAEPDIARLLDSNRVPREAKLGVLAGGLEAHIGPLAMNLVRLLNDRNKLHLARTIQQAFQAMVDEARGVAHATVTTAVPLSGGERTAIAARLSTITGKQVDVTPVVDASIIGGLVARIGDQLIDGSTRTRLVALKRRLAGATR